MESMPFAIVTPSGITYSDKIDKATIPTLAGEITILPDHAPLVSIVGTGEITIVKGGIDIPIAISGGMLEITPDGEVSILAEASEHVSEIDPERAEHAKKRAEELLKQEGSVADIEFAALQARLQKQLNRIHLVNKYRK